MISPHFFRNAENANLRRAPPVSTSAEHPRPSRGAAAARLCGIIAARRKGPDDMPRHEVHQRRRHDGKPRVDVHHVAQRRRRRSRRRHDRAGEEDVAAHRVGRGRRELLGVEVRRVSDDDREAAATGGDVDRGRVDDAVPTAVPFVRPPRGRGVAAAPRNITSAASPRFVRELSACRGRGVAAIRRRTISVAAAASPRFARELSARQNTGRSWATGTRAS